MNEQIEQVVDSVIADDEFPPNMDEIIGAGIHFLRTMTEGYGNEKGMKFWEALGEVMGQDVKGRIFFAMLTGDHTGSIRAAKGTAAHKDKITIIKHIREMSGMGLKEAKDMSEEILDANRTVSIPVQKAAHRQQHVRTLRTLGINAS